MRAAFNYLCELVSEIRETLGWIFDGSDTS